MHNAALEKCGIEARYTRLHIGSADLAAALRLLPAQGFIGVNLTIPHKAGALPLMDRVDPHARRIGVINTVVVEGHELVGFNTDGPGLVRAVRAEFGAELRDLRVMVLGAGGGGGEGDRHAVRDRGLPAAGAGQSRTLEKAQGLAVELAAACSLRRGSKPRLGITRSSGGNSVGSTW